MRRASTTVSLRQFFFFIAFNWKHMCVGNELENSVTVSIHLLCSISEGHTFISGHCWCGCAVQGPNYVQTSDTSSELCFLHNRRVLQCKTEWGDSSAVVAPFEWSGDHQVCTSFLNPAALFSLSFVRVHFWWITVYCEQPSELCETQVEATEKPFHVASMWGTLSLPFSFRFLVFS